MKLTVFLPDVYAYTESEMNLKVKLKDGVVQDVTYISMNGSCEEGLEYAAESEETEE